MKIGIVGLGPAGCIFLASLPKEYITKSIIAFDSGCITGDLARYYGCVVANLTAQELIRALRIVPRWKETRMTVLESYAPEACPSLADLCRQLRILVTPLLSEITVHTSHITDIYQTDVGYKLHTTETTVDVEKVILCTGSVPKQMDIPKPNIPLDMAMCEEKLRSFVKKEDRVVVFGTAHSGTLILRNLKNIGCKGVVGIYKGAAALRWARDGDPEGVKQESAHIADEIVAKTWGELTPTFVSSEKMGDVLRCVMEADYVIYAVGFQTRSPRVFDKSGSLVAVSHDHATGKMGEGMWGFGIAYPSMYQTSSGKLSNDVSFSAFASHISACLPLILSS